MILPPTRLGEGEEYASAQDILQCPDLPEQVIKVPEWTRNGRPAILRVRALSLEQKEAILFAARSAPTGQEEIVRIERTILEGCLLPKFDPITAAQLRHKNPDVLKRVYDTIWFLSALNQALIDQVVAQEANVETLETPDAPGGA